MYNLILTCIHVTTVATVKQKLLHIISQHEEHMCHTKVSFVASLTLPHFSTLSHKWQNFSKNLLDIKSAFWYSLRVVSEKFLILRRNHECIQVFWSSIHYTTSIFSTEFWKTLKYKISNSILWDQSYSMCVHGNRQTCWSQ